MLTSQGDQEQIYVSNAGGSNQRLTVLSLSQSVDDTAWPTQSRGTLDSTDSTNDSIDTVTGPFVVGGPVAVATPCGADDAPATCPAPGFPANLPRLAQSRHGAGDSRCHRGGGIHATRRPAVHLPRAVLSPAAASPAKGAQAVGSPLRRLQVLDKKRPAEPDLWAVGAAGCVQRLRDCLLAHCRGWS